MARIFARRKPAVTAAVQPVRDPAKMFRATLGAPRGDWQTRAWEMYELSGELRYVCSWLSGALSRCRLVGSEIDPETGRPTGETENAKVNKIVRDIAGGLNGQAQMLGRFGVFLTVPGEGYLAVITRPDGRPGDGEMEEWHLLDRSEITLKGGGAVDLTLADGSKHEYNPDRDVLVRVWDPHPRNSQEADSPVRSALPALAEIVQTTDTISHAGKSRLIGNKILFVPQEMSLPRTYPAPTAIPVDPDAPALPPPVQQLQASPQDLQDMLFEVAEAASADQNSAAAHLPIIASVAGEWTDKVKLVDLHSDVTAEQLKVREAAIRRLALGLDIPAEVLLGISEMNHWNAWAMGESAVSVHVVPLLELICDAITTGLLRPILEREGLDPDQYVVWHDTTALTQDPDRKQEALDANDRGALTNESLLKHLGFTVEEDGYDLDTAEGWRRFARDVAARKPELLPILAPVAGIPLPDQPAPAATAPPSGPRAIEAPSEQEPPEPDAVAAAAEPARALASLLLSRALELAGKRRLTNVDRGRFAGVPAWQLHTRMPAVTDPGEVSKLIAGWDTGFTADIARSVGADPGRLRALIVDRATHALASASDVTLTARELREVLR
ncbi:hypothetical protein IU501_34790 [Nocardia otitidiscaviarum]|uniref:hypothetical protein n=1 Tax=Nocardia otitidiscaviarum TaxID=1823 RepID=UPI001894873D|nr:hypothetical protein [Nocardia otitidiscaviarum]MBF6138139.1 hypothetical protein [Nocardia otitidiscaviarum]